MPFPERAMSVYSIINSEAVSHEPLMLTFCNSCYSLGLPRILQPPIAIAGQDKK